MPDMLTINCMDCDEELTPDELVDHECEASVPVMYCGHVAEFTEAVMTANGKDIPVTPQLMSDEAKAFIKRMVNDELEELDEAENIEDQADALLDAIIYICDTAARHGMNLDKCFATVHTANMSKINEDGTVTIKDGKVLKPEGFIPPDLYQVIKDQHTNGSW